jgi:hypothetical protein
MAPEQACGRRDLTTAVDVYGLGRSCMSLLTPAGRRSGATVLDTCARSSMPNRPARSFTGDARRPGGGVSQMSGEAPAGRYGSAEALAET